MGLPGCGRGTGGQSETSATQNSPNVHHDAAQRLWAKVDTSGECWRWTGGKTWCGYGLIKTGPRGAKRTTLVHRLAWELVNGPVPDGLELDHLCGTRECVRVDHLEAVTHAENLRRAAERRTHCFKGHPITVENTARRGDGRRVCLACEKIRKSKLAPVAALLALALFGLGGCDETATPRPQAPRVPASFKTGDGHYRLTVFHEAGATCFLATSIHRDEGPSLQCLPDSALAKDGGR